MSAIRQFNVAYVAPEDRLLVRIAVGQDDEYRFWLTRACMKDFAPQAVAWRSGGDDSPKAAVQAFRREAAVAQADYSQPLTPGENFPLGAAPVLVVRVKLTSAGGQAHLVLHLADARLVTLNLEESALAAVQHLLLQAAAGADWNLPAAPLGALPPEHLH